MIKLMLTTVALFALMHHPSSAESVWCRNLSIGCPTEADRAKALKNCQMLANESYQKALVEASRNPSVWQLAGQESAQDYANSRGRLMMEICVNKTMR